MNKHHQILIIGGGNAGLSVASQLLNKNPKLDVAILDPAEKHYYQPAWTLVGGGTFDVQKTVRSEASVMNKKASWIQEGAATFEPNDNAVVTTSGARYTYDYLVVCPGIQLDWHKVKGLEGNVGKNGITSNYSFESAPYTYELIKGLKKGTAIFTAPNTPVKCGGAPQKIMYLAGDYWRKHGVGTDVQSHFYAGGNILFGVEKYAKTLQKVVDRYRIQTHFKHNLSEVRPDDRIAIFDRYEDGKVVEQLEVAYDMIHVTPPQSAPDFIKNSPLAIEGNKFGWVDVDKHSFRHNRFANIFSLGDVSSTPNAKTGAAIRKQAPVLVAQILSLIETGEPATASYDGYGSCPLVTGYGKLVLAEFDYNNTPQETFPFDQSKERWSMFFLKKHILPWLYWNRILTGKA